ncbi:MAG: TIR domain-containing protein, partial [Bacteroidota bacterium]
LADSIEKGIEKSKHVLLVISTHSLASPWVALEEAISNYVDVDASDRKVIPLLLENVEDKIKPRIRRLNMVNLVDHTKREHQIRKLLLELNIENTQTIQIPDRVLALGKSCLDVEPIPFSMNSHIEMIKEEQNIEARFNIAVLGKTGVGKSTLINYLFGADVRKAGVGTPITQRGFHREDLVIQGIPATLFDSEGLEVGNSERWLDSLKQELNLRSAKMPSQEWFHTVIYCVASSSARIEEFELRILNEFIDSKYKIIVAMTKSDITAQEDIDDLEKAILSGLNSQVSCVAVSSERKKLRTGTTERFGAEEIYKCIHSTFWDAISYRLPERCISILKGIVDA